MKSTVAIPGASCQKCDAGLDALVIGGVGDWRTKIMCAECGQFWPASQYEITRLASIQYGVHELAIQEADARSQAEYESVCLGGPQLDDLPASVPVARWHARRLAERR